MLSTPAKLAIIATLAAAIIASVYVANLALTSPVDPALTSPMPSSSPSATVSTYPSPSPSPTQNNSAIYTFTVTPTITSYESYWNDTDFNKLYETTFHVNAQITWDKNQAPYVRYYEITPHFNGNTKPTQKIWGGTEDFRIWGLKSWASVYESTWVENEIYFLGSGAINYLDPSHYAGLFDNYLDWNEQGLHGVVIGSMTTTYDWYFDDAGATEEDLAKTEQEMLEFAESYFEGWTFTVKPVS